MARKGVAIVAGADVVAPEPVGEHADAPEGEIQPGVGAVGDHLRHVARGIDAGIADPDAEAVERLRQDLEELADIALGKVAE
jgi:hypothetical protein